MHSDLIIIGAGPGGYETAVYAAKNGLTVTIIEESKVGGTCLNEGCIPTKSFCRNAALMEDLKEAGSFGLTNLSYTFDFQKVVERKNQVVNQLISGVEFLLKNKLISLVQGKASFKDSNTIVVNSQEYTASHIIVATGSVTKYLPIEGSNLPGVISSKEILDIDHVPQHLCIIGGGVIGMEFASIFNAFGSKVTVLEYMKEILPSFDTDLTKRLKQSFTKKGIDIINQAAANKIETNADEKELIVSCEVKGQTQEFTADVVLMAVGRTPKVDSMNFSDIGIDFTKQGITVNENMQTNIPHIYAVGDVNGKCLLAHAATFQGIKAVNHLLNKPDSINLNIVPSAVFTFPEVAVVGLTEEQCKEKGIVYKAKKAFFRANGKAVSMAETDGYCKLIVNEERRILGCHIFGAHAADLVHEISSLMSKNTTVDEFVNMIHAHPTLSEVIQECAREF